MSLPWIEGALVAGKGHRRAAWELYVELVTRIAVQPLAPDEGILREALTSLHALFGETRRVLKDHGPNLAVSSGKKTVTLGQLAIAMLNDGLRPLLAKWHPLLAAHEAQRPQAISNVEHERSWPRYEECRRALETKRQEMMICADALARACGVPVLHRRRER